MAIQQEVWSGRVSFILANVAAAVGLGSIWKFPYEVGTNGGGAFVACYLAGLVLIVLPLMLCELAIGRRGRSDAIGSVVAVAAECGASKVWSAFALLGVVTGVLILSFYSVIGGWALAYLIDTITQGISLHGAADAHARFQSLLGSPGTLLLYHFAFMAITAAIVANGVSKGIERASVILMPSLIVLVVALAAYSTARGGFWPTWNYLFAFQLTTITAKTALEALGLGFFSIGVGLSIMIAYAAYAKRDVNLREVAIVTLISDTAISFLAAFAVFPIVFAEGMDPTSGPGLVFVTLPFAFSQMPFGTLASGAFFLLLTVAAVGSAISFLELATTPLQHAFGWRRTTASIVCAAACWVLGIASVFSFNLWTHWFPLEGIPVVGRLNWFDLLDHVTSNLMLPLGGLGIAIFVGWVLPRQIVVAELGIGAASAGVLYALLRYVVPAGIAAATLAVYF
jgi:NSS family neurotransmitter:Na+ symporter